jgi:hypothetical protein
MGAVIGFASGHTQAGATGHPVAYRPPSATRLRFEAERCSTLEESALGVGIPFLTNPGAGECELATNTTVGSAYSATIWVVQGLTWAAASLAVAGYTGLVRRT